MDVGILELGAYPFPRPGRRTVSHFKGKQPEASTSQETVCHYLESGGLPVMKVVSVDGQCRRPAGQAFGTF